MGDRATDNGGDAVGESDHEERHQPQHRRSVGHDQQQRHHECGDGEQRDVGPGERVRDVGAERGPAGDLDQEVVGQPVSRGIAQCLDRITECEARQPGIQRHRGHRSPAVLGRTSTGCCLIALRSAGVSAPPSRRLKTTIAGTWSPPGNCARTASARADSALVGTGTGDCSLESSLPIRPISAPETISTASASTHENRPVMTSNISDT